MTLNALFACFFDITRELEESEPWARLASAANLSVPPMNQQQQLQQEVAIRASRSPLQYVALVVEQK